MDHDFAFAFYFKSRKTINLKKLKNALPDLVLSFKKMVEFDVKKYEYYYNSTVEQYMVLKEIAREDEAKSFKMADMIDKLDDQILDLKVHMTKISMLFSRKIGNIQLKDDAILKQLNKDVIVDNKRLMDEKLEQENVLHKSVDMIPSKNSKALKVKS